MARITLDQIEKSFGETRILKGISLDIDDGAFVTLVGPSGCGKSTLLRILAGLEQADRGEIHIDARNVSGVRPAARDLAMVFQSYALYPHLSVAQNMLTPLKMRDLSARQRLPLLGPLFARKTLRAHHALVRQTAETLQITHLLDRKPGQLSGGQRQRVALGRAMVRQPKAFLMDEPLSNLDAALRVHMRSELSQLHKQLGATFVYVTHDQAEALTMSDRMAVMMGGRVLQYGPPSAVYGNPANLDVACFVGSPKINLMPAHVDRLGAVQLAGRALGLVADAPGPVQLGVRAEHLELVAPEAAMLRGTVRHHENLGSDIFVHLALETDSPAIVRCAPEAAGALGPGAAIGLRAPLSKLLLFRPDGERLAARPAGTGAGLAAQGVA